MVIETMVASKEFAAWLEALIEDRQISGNQLASYVGVSSPTVSAWRRGLSLPTPEYCNRLAEYFKRDLDEVLAVAGHRRVSESQFKQMQLKAELDDVRKIVNAASERLDKIESKLEESSNDSPSKTPAD